MKSLAEAVQELREDPEFMERLNRRLEEDRPVLEALRKSEAEEDKKQKVRHERNKGKKHHHRAKKHQRKGTVNP